MLDIVATIQAEQDEIIRAPSRSGCPYRGARAPGRRPSDCTGPRSSSTTIRRWPATASSCSGLAAPSCATSRRCCRRWGRRRWCSPRCPTWHRGARCGRRTPWRCAGSRATRVWRRSSPPHSSIGDARRSRMWWCGPGRRAVSLQADEVNDLCRVHHGPAGAVQGRASRLTVTSDRAGPAEAPGGRPSRGGRALVRPRASVLRQLQGPSGPPVALGLPGGTGERAPHQCRATRDGGPGSPVGVRMAEPPAGRGKGTGAQRWTADDLPCSTRRSSSSTGGPARTGMWWWTKHRI